MMEYLYRQVRLQKCLPLFLLFVFVECTIACTDTNIEVFDFGKEQKSLSKIIATRVQIYSVEYENKNLIISLKDEAISIDNQYIPYISIDKNGCWTVNGDVVPGARQYPQQGKQVFPSLSISNKGLLLVDGHESHFNWNAASLESIYSNVSWVFAVAQVDSYLCFYRFQNNNSIVPIANLQNYIIPDYFFDEVVKKELMAEELAKSIPDDEKNSYVFFTDAHWGHNQKHSPAIIKHIVDYTSINRVLFGGDANTSYTETVQGTLDIGCRFHDAFSFLGGHLYCLFGNHDDNSTGQPSLTDRHLTEEQVYGYLQSQMTNVYYWDYYNFYYDDPVSKTRFICMDTGRLYLKTFRNSILKTAKFAIESLSDVPDGWHVVAASHIWANLKSFETGEMKESDYVRPIIEILENYNLRTKSSFSYGGESIGYDFSNAGGTIEYCIGGHTHSDGVVISKNGLPLIIVTCDGQQEVAGNAPYKTGTINEQCVTIVVNDYKKRQVNIFHIGRGNDLVTNMWSVN